ncbi:MAG: hypothetical protein UW82_C0027G0006 [candidate division WWE3 bacterium GW2011_GWC2_44_9]|uniref:LysM domain-containing protein n=2 Tax=Katanobacteria TaxID=422282 RepID=A0A0G1NIW5_UNCKA|nr:MAG: hypothetical protein UW82_C0027G0006 [candidate division WWE3 bacterium GW2011_GWC2_44_9]OGC51379.1 MAG: hypothetical protein A2709_02750 [candidate division WWE3 bacterium RIFCSPHIGHO2_01_FULL_43_9]
MKNDKALIFLALVFAALFSYWTFNQVRYYQSKEKAFSNVPDTSSTFTENLADELTPEESDQTVKDQAGQVAGWVANDYKQGDISSGMYTVKSGDTLWEIAEGVYGDGTMWVQILDANASQVGYLSNGQQALIFPNQTLLIP